MFEVLLIVCDIQKLYPRLGRFFNKLQFISLCFLKLVICFYFSIEIIEIIGVCFVLHVLFHVQNHVVPYGMLEKGGLEKERVALLHNCPTMFDVVHLE